MAQGYLLKFIDRNLRFLETQKCEIEENFELIPI